MTSVSIENDDLPENQTESEEDLPKLSTEEISRAVLSGTDWTTETIINQIDKGNIILNPTFQRRDAWTEARKSKFVESLFLGFPIPQIVLAESATSKGKYIVLDGKQRLLSLRRFMSCREGDSFIPLKLSSLEILSNFNGMTYTDIRDSGNFQSEINSFENSTIRTVIIRGWPNEAFLYQVFLRLNTGSVQLSPQELRQALHPGRFLDYLDMCTDSSVALSDIFDGKVPDFRMRDVELLLRYFAFTFFLDHYAGNLKVFLDDTCKELNNDWINREAEVQNMYDEFEAAHSTIKTIFGRDAYHKWVSSKGEYENRFNRAVFDIMLFVFKNPGTRTILRSNGEGVVDLFKELCSEDSTFINAIERTTKSLESTSYRISAWARALNNKYEVNIALPTI
jgi:Protein of unknown function DUF262.